MASPTPKSAALSNSQATSFIDASTTRTRRAQAPSMSFDSLKAFQSFLGSNTSTPSSRYLSPPVSIADRSSPPPHQEAEDYVTSGDHHVGKRTHSRRREQRSHSPFVNSEESAVAESFLPETMPTMPTADSEAKKVQQDENRKSEDIAHNTGGSWTPSVTAQPQDKSQWVRLLDSIAGLPRDVQATSASTSHKVVEDSYVSPAINSLRRHSRCSTQPLDTDFMDIRRLSRAVTTTLSAVFTSKDADPAINPENENTIFPALTNHANDLAFTGDRLHVRQVTPATITLRKATQPCQALPTGASETPTPSEASQSVEPPFTPPTSIPNLLAFSSKRVGKKSASSSSSFSFSSQNDAIGQQSDTITRRLSFMTHDESPSMNDSPTTRRRSGTLPSGTTTDQGHSLLADTALTKTGVFPYFGAFINPCSKPGIGPPNRTSVVQFVSRTSIHEIIWRETESSSSGSESSLITPKKSQLSGSASRSPAKGPQTDVRGSRPPRPEAAVGKEPSSGQPSPPSNAIAQSIAQREAQEALFSWTWDADPFAITESPATYSSKSSILNPSRSARLPRKSSTFGQGALPSSSSVSSRRSTSGWRMEPLTDFKGQSTAKITRAATASLETMGREGQLHR